MPELPEVEALRRSLDESLSLAPIEHAGPAHLATLKTAEPPLRALEGRRLAGVRRRGKRLLFPTADGELVLVVHLMSAGRLRLLAAQKRGPVAPAFQLSFEGGARLILTEPGKRKRAGVWLLTPERVEKEFAHLGPDALGLEPATLARLCKGERRRLHGFLRDQRVLAGIGRAWANEILHTARLSPFALAGELDGEALGRLAGAISSELERGIQLREQGLSNDDVYRVHGKLGQTCRVCQTPIAQVAFEEHTIYYCPRCQTGGRKLADRRLSRLLR
ncbi:MAG TPA: DNA-formamidopyrimidine glycosylase family protein [Gaiellaceae bacterium]